MRPGVQPVWRRFVGGCVGNAGDAAEGLRKLRLCASEGGIFRIAATDALLGYHIALKEMLFLPWSAADWDEADALVEQATALVGSQVSEDCLLTDD